MAPCNQGIRGQSPPASRRADRARRLPPTEARNRIREDHMQVGSTENRVADREATGDGDPIGPGGSVGPPWPWARKRSSVSTFPRRAKELAKRGLRGLFEVGQRWGFDLLPRHFYSQVPHIRELRADPSWKQSRSLIGVRGIELAAQFD